MALNIDIGNEGSSSHCKEYVADESSESEDETEPAKVFNRRLSTNKDLKNTKCIKDGYLYKQASFQRWRKRFFKLKGCKLYYAKHTKSSIFDEIELIGASLAECSIKNINHSFQVITPFRNLVLCADHRREMEEWISALRAAANKEYYDPNSDHKEMLSGQHHWYACSHARPTYCNVCREALSGVTSHGLSCEVCKFKVHKRCAASAAHTCKWTTLSSVGDAIIEDDDRNLYMPHQWVEGNLAVSAKCSHCDKTCGSVLRLQDWRCLWCKSMVHSTCKDQLSAWCTLGQHRISILPPIAVNNLDSDGLWEASKPVGVSPLLVFINSRSGNNQGIKMYRRFKQLLNPAQVFDLNNGGPGIGLRLFKNFDSFRIVVCGGDGTIGWVLTEIDVMELHKQCQVGVLPLGTGNDLARVLGWGGAFDDDAQLPSALDRLEHAQVKILDRWSILTYEGMMPDPRKASYQFDPMSTYEHNVADHLSKIIHSDDHNAVISSAKVLCETVKSFVDKVAPGEDDENEETIDGKCKNLNEKLDALMSSLDSESKVEPVKKPEAKTRVALMSRANSLKKCVRQIIEQTEKVVDEQNAQTKVLHKQCKAMSESNIESAGKSVDMQIMTAGSPSNEALPSLVEREEDSDGLRLPRKASPDNRERLKTNGPNNEDLVEQAANIDDALLTAASHKGVGLFPSWHKSGPSRRLSSMSTMHKVISFVPTSDKDKKSYKEATAGLSIFNKPPFPRLPKRVRKDLQNNIIQMTGSTKDVSSGMASKLTGGGLISKVLLANADALCAAVSPLVQEELDLGEYGERYVMNNYFGIGLDAKVTLDFHNKRETHPEQFKSRNKNKIWFGVISSREFLNKTYKNLEQKVQLECDGQKIPLPNLQGLVILNIASYMAGIPFWGTAKGDETFKTPSMDDHILEVVAVFGIAHMGVSRFLSLQRHRIAQCQSVKITILGDEGVPIQVDGEAWLQPPGYIQIIHKNRAQMLTRDKVFEEAMKTWMEKVHLDPPSTEEHPPHELSEAEISLLQSFVEATESLIKNVKMASICHTLIDQELSHLANQSSCFLDRLYPEGQLTKPTPRSQVSDLVSSVRTLYNETNAFFSEKISALHINADVEEKVMVALGLLEVELRKVYEIGGLPHFHTMVEETQAVVEKQKEKARFRPFGRFKKVNKKEKDVRVSMSTNVQIIESWSKEDVCQWLKTLELLDYCDSFFTNEITGKELLTLGRQDLKDIGVSKVGHVKRILQEIKALRQKSPLPDYRNS